MSNQTSVSRKAIHPHDDVQHLEMQVGGLKERSKQEEISGTDEDGSYGSR